MICIVLVVFFCHADASQPTGIATATTTVVMALTNRLSIASLKNVRALVICSRAITATVYLERICATATMTASIGQMKTLDTSVIHANAIPKKSLPARKIKCGIVQRAYRNVGCAMVIRIALMVRTRTNHLTVPYRSRVAKINSAARTVDASIRIGQYNRFQVIAGCLSLLYERYNCCVKGP